MNWCGILIQWQQQQNLRLQRDRWGSVKQCGHSYQGGGSGERKLGCECCWWKRLSGRLDASETQWQNVRVKWQLVVLPQRHRTHRPSEISAAITSDGECLQRPLACMGSCENMAVNEALWLKSHYVLLQLAGINRETQEESLSFFLTWRFSFIYVQGTTEEVAHVCANYKCAHSPIDSYYMLKSIVAVAG